jgi:LacI family transcriptional regulator
MAATYRIAVVLETFAEHCRAIMRGVANYLERNPAWELHSIPMGRTHVEILNAAVLADGIITRPYTSEMADLVQASGKPCVAVQYYGRQAIPNVGSNHEQVGNLAAEHLASQGFREFAFFGSAGKQFSLDRANAFERALTARGFACHVLHAGRTEPETIAWNAPDPAVVRWLLGLPQPVGVLAGNDFMARQLLLAAKHAELRVPDDLAVVGVDNDELICRFTSPRLSSIDIAGEQIGYTAAQMLDKLLHGQTINASRVLVDPARLVVRQSSDVLAVADPNVAAAVRFIREHTAERMGVEDVLAEVPVARRTLEKNFRRLLGRSIHEEIVESRIRRAKQLLADTEMSIPEITAVCGFANRGHLSEVFRQRTGQAPAAYRRERCGNARNILDEPLNPRAAT